MSDETRTETEEVPKGQVWFDRIWLWFILSFLVTGILYTVWGLIEILATPAATY